MKGPDTGPLSWEEEQERVIPAQTPASRMRPLASSLVPKTTSLRRFSNPWRRQERWRELWNRAASDSLSAHPAQQLCICLILLEKGEGGCSGGVCFVSMTTAWVRWRLSPPYILPCPGLLSSANHLLPIEAGHSGNIPPPEGAVTIATHKPSSYAWGPLSTPVQH